MKALIESRSSPRGKCGQILLEYTVAAGVMLVIVGILTLFLYVFKEYGARVMDLVASEYP